MIHRLLVPEVREEISRRFLETGFSYVAVDLQGYRTGSFNEAVIRKANSGTVT